ncbi:hypothetical protein LEP1GSC043_3640 [Leptospira weilii str. Ecochallenge]|uniref:Uncharacterized protein n=2 Tax=Leptospira weilii TaxID=28184 RepID=N1TVK2_9LEPT|nr:hypothetical protein LEP1GSC108_2307 [Leptospira weilii str. UI 13098]EMY12298.1 hypothetical protein LEP1GSC043_3640 [Leptospira weilii str. Ecochallenge]OMI17863.1 hypothetical protein BUQ74_07935 [Leptospira weilii serovar Heyan]
MKFFLGDTEQVCDILGFFKTFLWISLSIQYYPQFPIQEFLKFHYDRFRICYIELTLTTFIGKIRFSLAKSMHPN